MWRPEEMDNRQLVTSFEEQSLVVSLITCFPFTQQMFVSSHPSHKKIMIHTHKYIRVNTWNGDLCKTGHRVLDQVYYVTVCPLEEMLNSIVFPLTFLITDLLAPRYNSSLSLPHAHNSTSTVSRVDRAPQSCRPAILLISIESRHCLSIISVIQRWSLPS